MNRRKFLRHATHSVAIPGLLSSMGMAMPGRDPLQTLVNLSSDTDKVLVMIYLQGGNDGLNTVVPMDQLSALNAVRPHVILPENKILPLAGTQAGFHPAFSDMKTLFEEDRLGIVQNVGYPNQNYSHFRSTDIWMSGSDADVLVNSGWPGRVLTQAYPGYPDQFPNTDMPDPLSVEIGHGSSLLFQGPTAAMSMVLNDVSSFYNLLENVEEAAPDTAAGEKLKFVRLIARQSQQYGKVVVDAAEKVKKHVAYPEDNTLADQLKVVSKLIAGGLKTPVYMVRLGGFDTHDAQVLAGDHTQGEHADLLKKVNDAIISFVKDLEFHGVDDRVLGVTFSEFGRRIVSNASLGTDHGAAAPMFVFGNAVRGGIIGSNPVIDRNSTYQHNLEQEFDFRQVNASIMQQWFGWGESATTEAMLGTFATVPVIGEKQVVSNVLQEAEATVSIYPNPMSDHDRVQVSFVSDGEPVDLQLVDIQGKSRGTIFRGTKATGPQKVSWSPAGLAKGHYFLVISKGGKRQSFPLIKR